MKHILALVSTLLAFGAAFLVYSLDVEVNKVAYIQKTIAKSKVKVHLGTKQIAQKIEPVVTSKDIDDEQKKKKKELDDKLSALKNKAGNLTAFKVSPLYRQKCASCHGVNGGGIIGPKLLGKTAEVVYKDLTDFKSGKRKNYVMYGLLSKMEDSQLKELADEIATFEQKLKEQENR